MLIWINGAFGVGKSSVAEALREKLGKAHVYDPEMTGYFLWEVFLDEMKRKGNFQHIPLWREFNYKILKHINDSYNGVVIAPMTIYVKQYYDEIVGNLINSGITVENFILSATKHTIIERLKQRGEKESGWEAQHIDICISAFDSCIPGHKIDAENKSVEEIAAEIMECLKL